MKLGSIFLVGSTIFSSTVAQTCIENIEDIYTFESRVTDTSRRRRYVLCPRRIFEIGTLNHNFDLQGFNVNPPLPIRPNMTIQCGDTAVRENLCWLAGGDVHLDATPFRGISDETVEGVEVLGVVFVGARKFSTWATKPGDITFRDCEWKDHTQSVVPVMLDWFDGSENDLLVTFDGCSFVDNRYFGRGSHTSLVYANSPQNVMRFVDSKFENNDMLHNNTLSGSNSFLVETLGPLTMEKSCFTNNQVGVSSVAVFGNHFSNNQNFQVNSAGQLCEFASVFENLQQFDTFSPLCVNAGNPVCDIGGTLSPTKNPTDPPTEVPTSTPSISPTTSEPSAGPTNAPSVSASPTVPGQTPFPTEAPVTLAPTPGPVDNSFVFPEANNNPDDGSTASSRLTWSLFNVAVGGGIILAMFL